MKTALKRIAGIVITLAGILIFPCCDPAGPDPDTGLTFTLADPATQRVASGAICSFRIAVKNNGPSPVTITCIKKANSLPDSQWSVFFCAGGNCFPAAIDSVDAGPLAVGAVDTCVLDIQTGVSGSGQAYFKIYSRDDPDQSYENIFTCTAVQSVSN